MSDMVVYRAVSFKKDQIAALYFTMSDIVHNQNGHFWVVSKLDRLLKEDFYIEVLLLKENC